jgi:hypothetical protein
LNNPFGDTVHNGRPKLTSIEYFAFCEETELITLSNFLFLKAMKKLQPLARSSNAAASPLEFPPQNQAERAMTQLSPLLN